MTAADEQLVAELAEALRAFDAETGAGIPDNELAAALLPVVLADRRRAVAEAQTRPDVMPFPAYGCDWGHCDEDSLYLRWADDLGAYLPVCEWHSKDRGLTIARADAVETGDAGDGE